MSNTRPIINIADFEISKEDIFNPIQTGPVKWNFSGGCPRNLDIVKRITHHPSFPTDLGKRITRACSLSHPLHSDTAAAQRSLLFSTSNLESIDEDMDMNEIISNAAEELDKATEVVGNMQGRNLSEVDLSTLEDDILDSVIQQDQGEWTDNLIPSAISGIPIAVAMSRNPPSTSKHVGGRYTGQLGLSMTLQDYWSGRSELVDMPVKFNGYQVDHLVTVVKSQMMDYISWLMDDDVEDLNPLEYEYAFFTARTLIYALNRFAAMKEKQCEDPELDQEIRDSISNELKDIESLIDSLTVPEFTINCRPMSDYIWATLRMSAHAYNHGKRQAVPPELRNSRSSNAALSRELEKVIQTVEGLERRITEDQIKKDSAQGEFHEMIFSKYASLEDQSKKITESLNALTIQVNNMTKTVSQANFADKVPSLRGDYRTGVAPTVNPQTPAIREEGSAWEDRTAYEEWFKKFLSNHFSVQGDLNMAPKDYATLEYLCEKNGYEKSPHNVMIIALLSGKKPSLKLSSTLVTFLKEAAGIPAKDRVGWGLGLLGNLATGARPKARTIRAPVTVSRTTSGTKITDSIWD